MIESFFKETWYLHMIPHYGYNDFDLLTGGKRYLEGSKEMYGKFENGQHQKYWKSLNQISG